MQRRIVEMDREKIVEIVCRHIAGDVLLKKYTQSKKVIDALVDDIVEEMPVKIKELQ